MNGCSPYWFSFKKTAATLEGRGGYIALTYFFLFAIEYVSEITLTKSRKRVLNDCLGLFFFFNFHLIVERSY